MASTTRPWANLYGLKAWRRMRDYKRAEQPICEMCLASGRNNPEATAHVDHWIPHKGNRALFFDYSNLKGLCVLHHTKFKQQIERNGYSTECDADGLPIHPLHPFNR